jgi:hypothetical protein
MKPALQLSELNSNCEFLKKEVKIRVVPVKTYGGVDV